LTLLATPERDKGLVTNSHQVDPKMKNAMRVEYKDVLTLHGKPLKYRLPDKHNPKPFRTAYTPRFRNHLQKVSKLQLPTFDLWSAGDIKIIAADFDHVPDWYVIDTSEYLEDRTNEMLWDDFRLYLSHQYGRMGLVLRSPSGKAKVLFKVEVPASIQVSYDIALDTLRHFLDEWDFAAVDPMPAALNRLYVNKDMLDAMKSGLEAIPIFDPILDSLDQDSCPARSFCFTPWSLLPSEADELRPLDGALQHELEWFLVCFMGGNPEAALQGIALPRIFLSKLASHHLGRSIGQTAFSRAIRSMVGRGLLIVVDDFYAPGRKAKLYRVDGVLQETLAKLKSPLFLPRDPEIASFLDKDIPDGQWYRVLWRATNFFRDEASFLAWAHSKQGIELRHRKQKAKDAWRCHVDPRFNRSRRIHPAQASTCLPEAI
jgi:hypothetical protein